MLTPKGRTGHEHSDTYSLFVDKFLRDFSKKTDAVGLLRATLRLLRVHADWEYRLNITRDRPKIALLTSDELAGAALVEETLPAERALVTIETAVSVQALLPFRTMIAVRRTICYV